MPNNIVILGHPLSAEENRLPFLGLPSMNISFIVPRTWKARSLNTQYNNSQEAGDTINICDVYLSGYNSFYTFKNLSQLLNQLKPSLIYCWEEPWCLSAFQTALWVKKNPTRMIFYSAENKRKRLPFPFHLIQNFVYQYSYGAIVVTDTALSRLVKSGYSKPINVIPLWIRKLPLHQYQTNNKTLLYIGRLIPLKGVDLLIKALVVLKEHSLKVIGDGPETTKLKILAQNEKVHDRIEFLGKVENSELFQFTKNIGLAVFPTNENEKQAEQFGKAALECISMGIPVLTSNTGNYSTMSEYLHTMQSEELKSPKQIANELISSLG